MVETMFDYVSKGATFDETRVWRYTLWRRWSTEPALLWIMLNPSTADENVLDNTLKKCEGFTRAFGGYGGFTVGNIFALRSTDPTELYKHPDPVGPGNDAALLDLARTAGKIVCGWGAEPIGKARAKAVVRLLYDYELYTLRVNKDGSPMHPLYIPYRNAELRRMW